MNPRDCALSPKPVSSTPKDHVHGFVIHQRLSRDRLSLWYFALASMVIMGRDRGPKRRSAEKQPRRHACRFARNPSTFLHACYAKEENSKTGNVVERQVEESQPFGEIRMN